MHVDLIPGVRILDTIFDRRHPEDQILQCREPGIGGINRRSVLDCGQSERGVMKLFIAWNGNFDTLRASGTAVRYF